MVVKVVRPIGRLRLWLTWWRVAGLAGFLYSLGSAAIILSPSREFFRTTFRISRIATYFNDRSQEVLQVAYVESILAGILLLVFASGLRSYLSRAEGGYSMWSHLVLAAAGVAAAVTLMVQPFAQTLALINAATVDDSILHAGIWFAEVVRTTVSIPIAAMVISASLVDAKTRVFGGTVAVMGLLAALTSIIGAAWTLTGTPVGVLGFLMAFGHILTLAWFAVVGVKLMLVNQPPLHMPGEGLFDSAPVVGGWTNKPA